ncbi:MAG: phosphoribosylpyrophosphate synthetase [Holophagaceae bacterium]|nr:phosphoribosylpyrophosphate synthetase [Holophagaceae bacterium]
MSDTAALPDDSPGTVSDAITKLAAAGYTADFSPRANALRCAGCGEVHTAQGAHIEKVFRFEGASDPEYQSIVMGLRCPACGVRGVLVSGYGPSTDPEEIELILSLIDRR